MWSAEKLQSGSDVSNIRGSIHEAQSTERQNTRVQSAVVLSEEVCLVASQDEQQFLNHLGNKDKDDVCWEIPVISNRGMNTGERMTPLWNISIHVIEAGSLSPLRNPHQDDAGLPQHGAVRRTDPAAGDDGPEHRTRDRPPERPHLSACALQEERDHDRSRWEETTL